MYRRIVRWLFIFPLLFIFSTSRGQTDTLCTENIRKGYHVVGQSGSYFSWETGSSGQIINGQGTDSVTIEWNNIPGLYRLKVTETNDLGCSGDPQILDVLIVEPSIKIDGSPRCNYDDKTYSVYFFANGDDLKASSGVLIDNGSGYWQLSGVPAGINVRINLSISDCSTFIDITGPDCKCPEPPPSVSLTSDKSVVCKGEKVSFTAIPNNAGDSPGFIWILNGLVVQNGTSSQYTTSSIKSTDIISVELVSNLYCAKGQRASSNSLKIKVNEPMPVTVNITSTSNILCPGKSISFTAKAINAGSNPLYQWRVNGKTKGTNSPKFFSSWLKNNDVIECLVTSKNQCVSGSPALSNSIRVTSAPVAGYVSVQDNNLCKGEELLLNVKGNTGPVQWQSADTIPFFTSILGATNNYHQEKIYQKKFFRVITQFSACPDTSKWMEANLNPSPKADFTFSRNGTDVAFKDNSSDDAIYREWDFGDNSKKVFNVINPVHFYDSVGSYNVCLIVKNSYDCADTTCKDVDVVTSLLKIDANSNIKVYPNPVENKLMISASDINISPENAIIYDMIGREVYSKTLNIIGSDIFMMDVSDLPGGIYLLRIDSGKTFLIRRFVKK